jgi:Na+/H+-dicarboxylate symporter
MTPDAPAMSTSLAPSLAPSQAPKLAQRYYQLALNPWMILACLVAGSMFGLALPAAGRALGVIGVVYVDLLKMIVLPFMVSAVIFSLQRLFKEGGAGQVMSRVAWVFISFALITAVAGVLSTYAVNPGGDLSPQTRASFGQIVGSDTSQSNTEMSLNSVDAPPIEASLRDVLGSLIPSNIFAALAQGEALKALVFALLFGFAIGQVPSRISDHLTSALETIYHACQTLTRWLNYPLPVVLFAMSAAQMGETGLEPIRAMAGFVISFILATLALLLLSVLLIQRRSGRPWADVLDALRAPFAIAVATRSSATCMPAMIDALADKLQFARSRVELLVPLSVSLLRTGPTLYYVAATLFIAQLYDRSLSVPEVGVVVLVSVLAGFASAGMSGLVTLSLVSTTSGYLGLPFEAAFILFVAVDPICDIARTVLIVIGNSAAVALVCPKPLKV